MVVDQIDQPVALIAQSMGGIIAVHAALKRTEFVIHLVLTATSGGVDVSDIKVEDWRQSYFSENPLAPRWFAEYKDDTSKELNLIQVPTLLLWGAADPISPIEIGLRLERLLPKSYLHVIPDGEHDLAIKHAANVAKLINNHLKL